MDLNKLWDIKNDLLYILQSHDEYTNFTISETYYHGLYINLLTCIDYKEVVVVVKGGDFEEALKKVVKDLEAKTQMGYFKKLIERIEAQKQYELIYKYELKKFTDFIYKQNNE